MVNLSLNQDPRASHSNHSHTLTCVGSLVSAGYSFFSMPRKWASKGISGGDTFHPDLGNKKEFRFCFAILILVSEMG